VNETTKVMTQEDTTKKTRLFALSPDGKQCLPNGNTIDWNQGLLKQISLVNDNYLEWIDHPKLTRCRLFDNDLMESITYTSWWLVPAIYIPWGILEVRKAYVDDGYHDIFMLALTWILGLFAWTLFEYTAHRFAFHWEPTNATYYSLHFIGHGLHHITPADEYRLVFPPAVSMPLAIIVRYFFYSIFPLGIAGSFSAGFVTGYALYESTHFLSHHCPFGTYLQTRFKYHSAHHFNPSKKNNLYGVSSQFWDVIFGTM